MFDIEDRSNYFEAVAALLDAWETSDVEALSQIELLERLEAMEVLRAQLDALAARLT